MHNKYHSLAEPSVHAYVCVAYACVCACMCVCMCVLVCMCVCMCMGACVCVDRPKNKTIIIMSLQLYKSYKTSYIYCGIHKVER